MDETSIIEQLSEFKHKQKESWGLFAPLEIFTTIPAATLVKFSQVKNNANLLDVGCGTGVVAITAAKAGIKVSGIDLSPELIKRAKQNAEIAGVEAAFMEGDVEELPYSDDSFDAVLSQFGHMFAPRPDHAISEMLRVLKPGGTLAFATWPPDFYVGKLFSLVGKYSAAPAFVSPPSRWGDTNFVREQLHGLVDHLTFDQRTMHFPALSMGHYTQMLETTSPKDVCFIVANDHLS